jgi:hypothetical protein
MVTPIGIRAHDDASRIAEGIVARWRAIDAALAPIIGTLGVATLYRRCIFLTGKTHPWLVHDEAGETPTLDLPALHAVLAGRDSDEAAAAGQLLLATFTELIGRLIGPSLAERLLNAHPHPLAGGPAAQDTPT